MDFDQIKNQNYWQLQLDDVNEPDLYPMRYDVVLAYADECNVCFGSFRLHSYCVPNPSGKSASCSSMSTSSENCKEYVRKKPENCWTVLNVGEAGRTIGPIL